jgi:PAS domain S-box-containing protein
MKNLSDQPTTHAQLRAEAEAVAEAQPLEPGKSNSDMLRQLHELQVSQIELEMQSAAMGQLQLLKEQFESRLAYYAELYERAPVAYFSIERKGVISRANLAAAALLNMAKPKLIGRRFEQFLAPDGQIRFRDFIANVFDSSVRQVTEVALFDELSGAGHVRIEANVDPESQVCRMIVTDLGGADLRESALRRAFVVFDSIREGVVITGADNRIVSVNPAFTRMTGYLPEEAIGRDPAFLGRGMQTQPLYQALHEALSAHGNWQGDLTGQRRDGTLFVAWLSVTPMFAADGSIGNFIGVFSDITERKQADIALRVLHRELDDRVRERTSELLQANELLHQEIIERERVQAALHETQHFFHATIDALSDRVVVLGENGIIMHANRACCDYAGHAGCGASYFDYCRTDPRWVDGAGLTLVAGIEAVFNAELPTFSMEYAFQPRRHDPGRRHWFQVRVSRFPGHGPLRVVVAHADITERKDMEEALRQSHAQLRQLAMHLETAKEDERKRIARDIHDDLGQNLLALRIDISMLGARTAESHPRLHRRVAAVLSNVDTTIKSVRGIMNELRPPVLDLGMQAAMEWQIGDFKKRSGIAVALLADSDNAFAGIDGETGVVLFRIVQEALSNVLRHAQARAVSIRIDAGDDVLSLCINDDGIGITPAQRHKSGCFGLVGIAERIAALGGTFALGDYVPGAGCCLTMHIPLGRADEEEAAD